MTDTVVVRTDASDGERVQWTADSVWQSGDFSALAAAVGERACVVLIDGASATLLEIALPVGDLATARRAAPYAVEEQLALPLDDTHLAIAARGDNRFAVVACRRDAVQRLRERIERCGLRPVLVSAEPFMLPWRDGAWCIAADERWAVIRYGASAGTRVPLDDLAVILAQLRQQFPDTARVIVHAERGLAGFPQRELDGLDVSWQPPLNAAAMLAALREPPAPALFDASPAGESRTRARRLWRYAAVVALAALLAYPLAMVLGNARLARSQQALENANAQLFRTAFPEVTRVVNPRVQAGQALAALRAGSVTTPRFLDLLHDFEQAFAGGADARTAVRNIAYSDGVLEISVETGDMAELERVRTALGAAGLGAEMLSAESTDSGVVARLRVRESS